MTSQNNHQEKQSTGKSSKKKQENQKVEVNQITPVALIDKAIELKADPEQLGKLLELQIRWEDRQAQKAFVEALAKFRSLCPPIVKSKTVGYALKTGGKTNYNYAPLDKALDIIKPIEMECGLNHIWIQEPSDKNIKVTCKLTHIDGHSESTTLSAPPDISGSKNPVQAIGSTVFYLERYTVLALLGIAPVDMDNDGGEPEEPKSKNMLIESLIKESYEKYSKNKKITLDRFKTELKNLYESLSSEERPQWNAEGIEFLVSKFE